MLEQRGPVGEEFRKSPGLHYPGCGPCPHRQAGVSSSSPERKQLSKQLLVSLHLQDLWDEAIGTLWEASYAVASSPSLMSHSFINQGFRAGFLDCAQDGQSGMCACRYVLVHTCASSCGSQRSNTDAIPEEPFLV